MEALPESTASQELRTECFRHEHQQQREHAGCPDDYRIVCPSPVGVLVDET